MVTALLSATWGRLGGNGYPRLRKWGIPLILLISHPNLLGVIAGLSLLLATSLPITLKGSDIKDNLWWIPILALIHAVSIVILHGWIGLNVALVQCLLIYLSAFGKIDWKYYEIGFWFWYGLNI